MNKQGVCEKEFASLFPTNPNLSRTLTRVRCLHFASPMYTCISQWSVSAAWGFILIWVLGPRSIVRISGSATRASIASTNSQLIFMPQTIKATASIPPGHEGISRVSGSSSILGGNFGFHSWESCLIGHSALLAPSKA